MGNQDQLRAWLGRDTTSGSQRVRLPTLQEVGYCPPNPDGSRQQCRNCFLWLSAKVECAVHDPSVIVPPDAVCGAHIYGKPQDQIDDSARLLRERLQPLTPELSGLCQVNGGASCDRCTMYKAIGRMQGTCIGTRDEYDDEMHPVVDPLGRCRKFELLG